MKNNIVSKALLALLLVFAGMGATKAESFTDSINAGTYGDGQHVIYELNVGSYTQEGTFSAAQARLPELKSLGVDIVWLMPIYPRGGGINSPYAATDFQAVNPSYGTVADLRAYVAAAHALGMQVWLDWVPNHMATNAGWVTSHPEYFSTSNGQMVHPNGYGDVYELNYGNAGLVNAMNDCLKYWIDQADVDGYRCDYVSSPTIPTSYWQATIPMLKSYKPGKTITMLAEADFSSVRRLVGSGFDYDYAWDFQERDLQNGFGTSTRASSLQSYAQKFVNDSRDLGVSRMIYLTSHDQNHNYANKHSLREKYGANRYLLTVLTYTLYGMPMIYNGEETGGEQDINYFDDTKIDWTRQDAKMRNTLCTLGALKHSQAALHDGKNAEDNAEVTFLTNNENNPNIVAYSRKSGDSEVIVMLNTANTPQDVTFTGFTGDYSLWLNSGSVANGVSRVDNKLEGTFSVHIEAKGYLVYVKGKYGNYDESEAPLIGPLTDDAPCSIYYDTDADKASVHAWMWNGSGDGKDYTASGTTTWPGDQLTELGRTAEGRYVYRIVVNLREGQPLPTNVIITENGTDDNAKKVEAAFVNHGYYVKDKNEAVSTVPTGIAGVVADSRSQSGDPRYYDLSGRVVSHPLAGVYIHQGRKFVVR